MKGILNPIYSRRKRFLPEYRDLFTALFKLPDKDVRDRVTDAVNGVQKCSECKNKIESLNSAMDVGTQTEDITEILNGKVDTPESLQNTEEIPSKPASIEKKRRKRKRNYPKVVKTAQHSDTTPVLKQENTHLKQPDTNVHRPKMMRTDCGETAVDVFFETYDTNILATDLETPLPNAKTIENIKQQMIVEWETCERFNSAGLLPIHTAIVQNDQPKLKRQIYVWNFRKVNLMDLLTDDGDNLIQLAIKENCYKSIIDELLKENIHLNTIDDDCNTIIHLAVTHLTYDDPHQHQQLLQLLESLLKKVDLEKLLEQNNDGLTALHIAVKRNEYLMVEKILNVVDERLKLKSVLCLNVPCADEKTFLSYYCKQCDNFEGRELNELKRRILNATDMKSGCTVLFFAMELGYEHIVYLLMAHMCNPFIKNLSGLDAKSYYTDYGNNASIIGALEKLSTALQN